MRARARRARVTYMALGRVGVEFLPRVIPPSLGSIFCVFVIAGATSTKPLFSFSLPLFGVCFRHLLQAFLLFPKLRQGYRIFSVCLGRWFFSCPLFSRTSQQIRV